MLYFALKTEKQKPSAVLQGLLLQMRAFYGETSTLTASPGDVGLEFTFASFWDAVLKKPRLSWKPDRSTAETPRLDAAGELLRRRLW